MTANESLKKYLDALGASYELLGTAASSAGDRGVKIGKQFTDELMAGQREALELAKKLAADPASASNTYVSSVTESAVSAQTRALMFAQLAYQEAVSAGSEGREFAEKIAKANQATADAAIELTKSWAAFNPMAELFVRGMESATAAMSGTKA